MMTWWVVCHTTATPASSAPGCATTWSAPASAQSCILTAFGVAAQWALVLSPKRLGEVLGKLKGVICCLYQEAVLVEFTRCLPSWCLCLWWPSIMSKLLLRLHDLFHDHDLHLLVALDQNCAGSPQPRPARLSCTFHSTSLCCNLLMAWSSSPFALHLCEHPLLRCLSAVAIPS